MITYSLTEVAAMVLPAEWKDPELWLKRRLRRHEIGGYKVGHIWRMTQADVDNLIEHYHTSPARVTVAEPADVSIVGGLSARAISRLRSA